MKSIFVSIGNGTGDFSRLLNAVAVLEQREDLKVVVQHGRTSFTSKRSKTFAFTDEAGFRNHLAHCDVFITHGGVGSICTAVELEKKAVVIPRRAEYDEIVDDHQLFFARAMADENYIHLIAGSTTEAIVQEVLDCLDCCTFKLERSIAERPYIEIVSRALEPHVRAHHAPKFCLVAAAGGHLTELRKFKALYAAHDHFYVLNAPIEQSNELHGKVHIISLAQRDWRMIVNFVEAWRLLRAQKPTVILTTGAWPAIPFGVIGRLLGIRVIYIETMAKVVRPTITGRAMKYIAHDFFYPWNSLAKFFPKGTYCGPFI